MISPLPPKIMNISEILDVFAHFIFALSTLRHCINHVNKILLIKNVLDVKNLARTLVEIREIIFHSGRRKMKNHTASTNVVREKWHFSPLQELKRA